MEATQSTFDGMVSPENLFRAWEEFRKGKGKRVDVRRFEERLEENILALHRDLTAGTYRHAPYTPFFICDPKQRRIHKATVRDRIVHHAVFAALNPHFEPRFIAHSFSCREGKGTHQAVDALERMLRSVSRGGEHPCFALKCDVRQFFASMDHDVLKGLLRRHVTNERLLAIADEVIGSFPGDATPELRRRGVPIGNLTSQLFANVYLNPFDQFVKHDLRVKHYVRYTDDFVVVASRRNELDSLLPGMQTFLRERLRLELHPRKVSIRTYRQGVDFLGYVLRPHHRVLRTKTKRRMYRMIRVRADEARMGLRSEESVERSLQSYCGVLSHADGFGLTQRIRQLVWEWLTA